MKYYHFRSILSAQKTQFSMRESTPSMFVTPSRSTPYIEPTFESVVWDQEHPAIVLVSAVGATGKTALAHKLSNDTNLPLLDLSKHKPVGDNTLTGLLTQAYHVADIGGVLGGLANGTYGVIIDGVDEGRSKTTEKAFEAFLDDIAKLCKSSPRTTFVLLGRSQTLDDCWTYLADKNIPVALVTISPFTFEDAKNYIDAFTDGKRSPFAEQYAKVRDTIIEKLGKAFATNAKECNKEFLSFIGYPPVLDAIVTLLKHEKNYHGLLEILEDPDGSNVEISLLYRIAGYILQREREQKVIPNIVQPLLKAAPDYLRLQATKDAFSMEEQCARLIGHCLGRVLSFPAISEPSLNEKYEATLADFLPEHPFLAGTEFRSAVFEAVALSTLMKTGTGTNQALLHQYLASHKHSYYIVYMLDTVLADHRIDISYLNALFTAGMEFRSVHTVVELTADGPEWDADSAAPGIQGAIEIGIEIRLGVEPEASKRFNFRAEITPDTSISLGPKLAGAFLSVPCSVQLKAQQEIELTAPVIVCARNVALNSSSLVLRSAGKDYASSEVTVEAQRLQSCLENIIPNDVSLTFLLADTSGVTYPAIQYVKRSAKPPADPLLRQKYMRLKRILVEFRSHSKGSLAKYKEKIEHERVLKNHIGRAVLNRLVRDQVLSLKGSMYHLNPDGVNRNLGVTWPELRKGQMPESVLNYLRAIDCREPP